MNIQEIKDLIERYETDGLHEDVVFNFVENDTYLIKDDNNIIEYNPYTCQIEEDTEIDQYIENHNIDKDFEDDEEGCMDELREFLGLQ